MAKCFRLSFVQKVGSDGVHQGGGGGGVSYTRVRELLLEKTEQLGGMDPSVFGMHSLWAGGTTAAVRAGVVHHLFKRYGRWRS